MVDRHLKVGRNHGDQQRHQPHAAALRENGTSRPTPPRISKTPLASTSSLGAGRNGGIIRRYAGINTKCSAPATTNSTASKTLPIIGFLSA